MTDPIQTAINRTLGKDQATANVVTQPWEALEEAQGLLRQARSTIDNLRLSVDGERRVKEQYLAELTAVLAQRDGEATKVRALKEQVKLLRENHLLGWKLVSAIAVLSAFSGFVSGFILGTS